MKALRTLSLIAIGLLGAYACADDATSVAAGIIAIAGAYMMGMTVERK